METISQLYTNPVSYTNRDIVSLRKSIIERIQGVTDSWTDFNESDIGVMLIEIMAGVADELHFYLDKQALENYLPTVVQKKNAKALLSLINYKFKMMVSSVATERFSVGEPFNEDLVIPKYTQLSVSGSSPQMLFVTAQDSRLPKGDLSLDVPIIQGQLYEVNLKTSDIQSQRINLPSNKVAYHSVLINMDGVDWSEVDDVFTELEPGTKFSVHEDKDDNAYIMLHVNYKNYLPKDQNASIKIQYLETMGVDGIAQIGMVDTLFSDISMYGISVKDRFSVTNIEATSGGSDREELDHARYYAPRTLATLDHAVQLEDYTILASQFPGVAKAQAIDWSVPGNYVVQPYIVDVYVVPGDGLVANKQLCQNIKNYLDSKKTSGITVNVYPAEYVKVDIDADVYIFDVMSKYTEYQTGIKSKIDEYFKLSNLSFGTGVRMSNITTLIETYSQNVDYLVLNKPSSNNFLLLNQFPQLGDVNIKILGSDINVRPD